MRRNTHIIIAACLAVALFWRGGELTPFIRLNFENVFIWSIAAVASYCIAAYINIWAGMFLLLATLSAYFPFNTVWSEEAYRFILYGVLWFAICTLFVKPNWVYNVLCIVCIYHVFILSCQYFDYNILGDHAIKPRFISVAFDPVPDVGIMDCFNSSSTLIALCFPAFLRGYWHWGLIIVGLGLIMSHTFGGILAVACAASVYVIVKCSAWQRVYFCLLIALAVVCFILFIDAPDITWRWNTWKFALTKAYPQHWLFGYGLGHWYWIFARTDVIAQTLFLTPEEVQVMDPAHNEFIQGLFEMGIGFAVLVCGYFTSIILKLKKKDVIPVVAIVSVVVTSSVFFTFHIGLLALISLTWMGILEKQCRNIFA